MSIIFKSDDVDIKKDISYKDIIIDYIIKNGSITNKICRELLKLEKTQVIFILSEMVNDKIIIRKGQGKNTYYSLNPKNRD